MPQGNEPSHRPLSPITRCALKLPPLLFVRPGELWRAEWSEINLDAAERRIPAAKMKGRVMPIVPLAKALSYSQAAAAPMGRVDRADRLAFRATNGATHCHRTPSHEQDQASRKVRRKE